MNKGNLINIEVYMKRENFKIKENSSLKKAIPFFILLFFCAVKGYCKNEEKTKSALAVIERLIGNRASEFELSIIENKENNKSDWFEIETTSNQVKIKASNNTAICYAAYNFLLSLIHI